MFFHLNQVEFHHNIDLKESFFFLFVEDHRRILREELTEIEKLSTITTMDSIKVLPAQLAVGKQNKKQQQQLFLHNKFSSLC